MDKKILITISRQAGIGLNVSEELSKLLDIPLHTNQTMAEQYGDNDNYYAKAGESIPANKHYGKTIFSTGSNTINEDTYKQQRKAILNIASEGSAIITGRCADFILEGYDNLITVFISADMDTKIGIIKNDFNVDEKEAIKLIKTLDKSRRAYYSYFTKKEWGATENYDLSFDMTGMSSLQAAEFIKAYIDNLQ